MSLFPLPWLLDLSLRASLIILLVFGLRPALRLWIGSRAVAALWLIIAARLLWPLPVAAPWRVPALFPAAKSGHAAVLPFKFRVSVSSADTPAAPLAVAPTRRLFVPPAGSTPTGAIWLPWLCGAVLAAARLGRGWWTIRRWAARTLPADIHPGLTPVYLTLPAELRRGVGLRLSDDLDAPTLVGVRHPQIWLPRALPDVLSAGELRHVLLHELGHARRRDLSAQWLCSLVCCVHWFNPLVWLLARWARADRELACDAWALTHDAGRTGTTAAYGHTLLKVVERMSRAVSRKALPAVSMAAGRRHLGRRLREIQAFRPVAPWRGAAALAVTVALVAAGTIGNSTAAPDTASTTTATPSPSSSPPVIPAARPPISNSASPARPRQVEIESKFFEVDKPNLLSMEKFLPPSSPVAETIHQFFARITARPTPGSPLIFRSALIPSRDFGTLVHQFNQIKGLDLLSAPRVTTKSRQKATIEIIREFIYPTAFEQSRDASGKSLTTPTDFEKGNIGLTLDVLPTVEPKGDLIDLWLTWTVTNLDGYVDADGKPVPTEKWGRVGQSPVIGSHSVTTVTTMPSGSTVVFSGGDKRFWLHEAVGFGDDEAKSRSSPTKQVDRLPVIFVTATLVDPPPASPTGTGDEEEETAPTPRAVPPSSSSSGSPASSSLPSGVPVPGKPGFVTSPYAPDSGIVDLRDFPRGESVRDPYTGKQFLVP